MYSSGVTKPSYVPFSSKLLSVTRLERTWELWFGEKSQWISFIKIVMWEKDSVG